MNYDHRRYVRCSNDFTVNFIIEAAPESLPLKSLNVSMYKGYSNLADIHQHCKWITRKDHSIDNCPMGELDNLDWLSDSDKVGNTVVVQHYHNKLIKDYEKVFGKSKITPVNHPESFTWTLVDDCHQPIDTKNATGTVFTAEPRIPRDFESTDIKLDLFKKYFYVQIWLEDHGIEPVCLPMKKLSPHQFAPSHFPPNLIKKETKIPSKQ
uniref:Uncharacterized protein n=1 Tax=Ditylenchus dipsaci TaxID=166011 RepID=A0A915DRS2_9BILA